MSSLFYFYMKINYKHLVQKAHFCGPTSLQMVLFRRGHWVEQEELAQLLGARIKNKNIHLFTHEYEVSEDDAGLRLEEFSKAADFLKEKGLKLEIIKSTQIKDFKELITNNLEKNNDIIVNFKRAAYDPEKDWGHFSLISAIENDELEICDPSYGDKSYWKTSINKLSEAISDKFDDKERGIVVISNSQ